MRKIKVTVTEEDIAQGVPEDGALCPVGRACARADIDDANFDNPGLSYYAGHRFMSVRLPRAARDFADAFDEGKPVQPFEFEFELPESWDEQECDE